MDTRLAYSILFGGVLLFLAITFLQTVARLFDILVVMFLGMMVSQAIEPMIDSMAGRGVPRAAGVLAIYFMVLLFVVSLGWLLIPPILNDLGNLVTRLPELADVDLARISPLGDFFGRLGITADVRTSIRQVLEQAGANMAALLTVPLTMAGFVVNFFTVLTFAFLFSVTGPRLEEFVYSFIHPDKRQATRIVGRHVGARLGGYVRSELLVMASVGILSGAGLLWLGLPFAMLFALIAFLTEAIPMVGPFLGAIPPIIVAAFISPWLAGQVALLYLAVQQVESYLLAPLIHGNQLSISPLLVITALLIGAGLFGIVGAFIAVPVAAALQVLLEDVVVPWRHMALEKQLAASVQFDEPPSGASEVAKGEESK
ncbi:MAG: AI-2E family transporter [Chloroflexota bacterium]